MVSILSVSKRSWGKIPDKLSIVRYVGPSEHIFTKPVIDLAKKLPKDTITLKCCHKVTGISESSLNKGVAHLTGKASGDTRALKPIVDECFVGIRSKEEAMEIFRQQFEGIAPDRTLYILNPSPLEKLEKGMGTSNSYMTELYREASSTGTIIDRTNISTLPELIAKDGNKKISIVVPDDFSGSGRSMIVNTAETLRNIDIPKGVEIELVYSPMCATPFSQKAFELSSKNDLQGLMDLGALNKDKWVGKNAGKYINDSEILQDFTNKYKNRMTIKVADGIIDAKPYNETSAYLHLKQTNPDAAQAIDILMTEYGKGYGRTGSSGTMVLTPGRDGILKSPNNNCEGALPFLLLENATPEKIKNPNQKWSAKKWQVHVRKIAKAIGVI